MLSQTTSPWMRRLWLQCSEPGKGVALHVVLGGQYELVFACPLADTDSCVQKKAGRGSIHPQDGYEFNADAGFKDVPESVDNAKAATHPYSGNTYKTTPLTRTCRCRLARCMP